LASQLVLYEMGADTQRVEFVEAPEDDEVIAEQQPPSASSIMEAEHHNAAHKPWRDRLALARSMGAGCKWSSFKAACAAYGMTPGESAAQLLAKIAPYRAAEEAAEQQRRKSNV
jgi:hypothetical protein